MNNNIHDHLKQLVAFKPFPEDSIGYGILQHCVNLAVMREEQLRLLKETIVKHGNGIVLEKSAHQILAECNEIEANFNQARLHSVLKGEDFRFSFDYVNPSEQLSNLQALTAEREAKACLRIEQSLKPLPPPKQLATTQVRAAKRRSEEEILILPYPGTEPKL